MSDDMLPELTGDDLLAAEFALGLLEGEELLMAKGRVAREPELAARIAHWEEQLAPMLDDIASAEPSPALWGQIEAALDAKKASGGSAEVIELETRLTRWKWATGFSAAAAAVALAFLALPQGQAPSPDAPPVQLAEAPLFANVPIEGTPLSLDLTYLPEKRDLLVAAVGLTHDGVHDHELWLVKPDGGVESLGVVTPGEVRAHSVPADYSPMMADGAQLLLTREPLGGKPEGVDAGPVVASGELTRIS
ncbi:anti-sigma factor [Altererythrobacter lutimaris]|uniref:Anti-sigma factor n=1 Tax=Altererythrobacter lutimaris TaxID=2743979 RepID=A0A850HB96_9SPHN|nr:anti-sigma factor [Altererythrobacter lutimaris]NVE94810.1 anti-sigma factor [Altererythrobacter lutimaris]